MIQHVLRRLYRFLVATCLGALLALVTLSGCARTVTDLSPVIYSTVTLYFRDPVDTANFNYYLILRHASSVQSSNPIVLLPTEPSEYFPSPGFPFNEDNDFINSHKTPDDETGIGHYYQEYFGTWSDYFIVTADGLRLFKSEAETFDSSTTQNATYDVINDIGATFSTQSVDKNGQTVHTLTITFPTDRLSNAPDLLYFAAATSIRSVLDTSGTGHSQDKFQDTSSYLNLTSAGQLMNTIESNPFYEIPGAADIIGMEASTF